MSLLRRRRMYRRCCHWRREGRSKGVGKSICPGEGMNHWWGHRGRSFEGFERCCGGRNSVVRSGRSRRSGRRRRSGGSLMLDRWPVGLGRRGRLRRLSVGWGVESGGGRGTLGMRSVIALQCGLMTMLEVLGLRLGSRDLAGRRVCDWRR
jgi:hypothetical protein